MNDPRFFGYGSLVNLATHDYPDPALATLTGWRRVWRHTAARPVAFLSVEPCTETEIAGVIARVPGADWAALDEREAAYDRQDVSHQVTGGVAGASVAVYQVSTAAAPTREHPILLSYIDVVVQGYLHHWGEDGALAFFETTSGWNAPILNDRAAPRYPRHQALSAAERGTVDRLLTRFAGQ